MKQGTLKTHSAMTAIAAVFALSSTQLFGQTSPETTQPVVVAPVIAVPDIAPTATTSEPLATSPSEPLASEPAITTMKTKSSTTTRRVAKAAPPSKVLPRLARAPVAAPVVEPAQTVAASPASLVAVPIAPLPVIAATPAAQEVPPVSNDLLLIAGAVGVALLGLIAFWLAMRRRKLRRDEEWAAADQYELEPEAPVQGDPLFAEPAYAPVTPEPIHAMPVVAASGTIATPAPAASNSACVDTAPGSHVEAACGGPTADNPSLSIKKRLKRAHFFDQREFLAAAGEVAPMAPDAGLPDAVQLPPSSIDKPA